MTADLQKNIVIVLDDREIVDGEVRSLVGARHFGEITVNRVSLADRFRAALPTWARGGLVQLRTEADVAALRQHLESSGEQTSLCVIAGRAGFSIPDRLTQLIERLPYAEEDFTDSLYRPLLVFVRDAHSLVPTWKAFEDSPMHHWKQAWQGSQRMRSVEPLDLGRIRDFLLFTSGSTATRHFNQVQIDTYYYTKRSRDKRKMLAEYSYYDLVPESMRPWLIEPFDFKDEGDTASYRTMRYYLADAALQWVHSAFDAETFDAFVERLLFFLAERPRLSCSAQEASAIARTLFVDKVVSRIDEFLTMDEGRRINILAASSSASLDVTRLRDRYLESYRKHEKGFATNHLVAGHGDPCFSNVLYDQQRYLLKLIDPKGATTQEQLWTHPLYDLCKISHSALGDYDFINNGMYSVGFSDRNDLLLRIGHGNQASLKPAFTQKVKAAGHDLRIVRLGEASLFLSMLPLHIDYPNKVVAFLLTAKQILDEVNEEQ